MIHLLLFAGVWNVAAEHDMVSGSYETTLIVKLVVVAVSGGFSAFLHARARSTAGLAIFGALTGLTALGVLFLGALLAG